jgi:hypothetical protein
MGDSGEIQIVELASSAVQVSCCGCGRQRVISLGCFCVDSA